MDAAPGAGAPLLMLLLMIPAFISAIVQLGCLVLVIVAMFQKGETGIGVACAVLSVCTGIGVLIAFVYGWVKASEWQLKKVMLVWTACFALNFVLVFGAIIGSALFVPVNMQQAAPSSEFLNSRA